MSGIASPEIRRKASQDYHDRNREAIRAKKRAYYQANKERESVRYAERRKTPRERARAKLRYAVWAGKVLKPRNCENCGSEGSLHGHHHDYGQPFEVRWLCRLCHGRAHRK